MTLTALSKTFLALTITLFLFGCDNINSLFKADPGKQASVIVQQQLSSPGSFKYVSSEVLWKGKSQNGEPAYVVSVVYDAQNAFGAMLRDCMLVSFYETSDNKVGWNPMFGVRDGNEYAACDPSPSAIDLKVKIATVWGKANSFVAQNASSTAPAASAPTKPEVPAGVATATQAKTAAAIEAQNVSLPTFTLKEKYSNARQKLLSAGWKTHHSPEADTCDSGDERCKDRPEMLSCAGSGLAPCKFTWSHSGKIAVIDTTGKEPVVVASSINS